MERCINAAFKNSFLMNVLTFILSWVAGFDFWVEIGSIFSSSPFYTLLDSFSVQKEKQVLLLDVLQSCQLKHWMLISFSSKATMLDGLLDLTRGPASEHHTQHSRAIALKATGNGVWDPSRVAFKFPAYSRKFSKTGQLFIEQFDIKNNLESSGKSLSSFPNLC